MKKILFALLLFASPLPAQVTQAKFDSLVARVTKSEAKADTLARVLGDFYTRCAAQLAAPRPAELPNGEYPNIYRQCQLGSAADKAYEQTLPGFQAQLSGALARIGVLETQTAGGQPVGTAVFDKIRANKVCIGDIDCDGDWNAQLQIRGNGLANIGLEANLAHIDPQDASHTHRSQVNVSTDGGTRIQQNCESSFSRGYFCYVNPCRQFLNFGPDSRSSVSLYLGAVNEDTCTPIAHDGAQDLVILPDEATKELRFYLMRPLWSVVFLQSSTIHAGDIRLVPKQ